MVPEYVRPLVEDVEFWDKDGRAVVYGLRRGQFPHLGPRGAGTNIFSHPERYAPIWLVADALIAHLEGTYEVAVEDDLRYASAFDIMRGRPLAEFSRVVRILPMATDEAALHIGFLNAPGSLRVVAGSFSEFDMWFCGCDACDEPWEEIADALEHVVLTVAGKGTTERLDRRERGRARYWLDSDYPRGWCGSLPKRGMRTEVLDSARRSAIQIKGGHWKPWTAPGANRPESV